MDAEGALSSPLSAVDSSNNQQGERRSSGEVETEKWKGRGSPDSGAVIPSETAQVALPSAHPPAEHAGSNGGLPIPTSKTGRRHVRDTSNVGVEKEPSSDNLGDVLTSTQGNRAESDVDGGSRRSHGAKSEGETAKKDGDSEICGWLAQLGMSQYTANFVAHDVTMSNIEEVDKEALQMIGVSSWGHRCAILKGVARLKENTAAGSEEEAAGQSVRASVPGARKRGGERDRSTTAPTTGTVATQDSHDNLKNVYEQIENMKMHFEAQMEQLNRELMATKAELASVKSALASQQVASNANGGSGAVGGKKGNSGGNGDGDGKTGAATNRNGKQQQRRKDNSADTSGELSCSHAWQSRGGVTELISG